MQLTLILPFSGLLTHTYKKGGRFDTFSVTMRYMENINCCNQY